MNKCLELLFSLLVLWVSLFYQTTNGEDVLDKLKREDQRDNFWKIQQRVSAHFPRPPKTSAEAVRDNNYEDSPEYLSDAVVCTPNVWFAMTYGNLTEVCKKLYIDKVFGQNFALQFEDEQSESIFDKKRKDQRKEQTLRRYAKIIRHEDDPETKNEIQKAVEECKKFAAEEKKKKNGLKKNQKEEIEPVDPGTNNQSKSHS